jgi:hypothetical protein
MGSLTMMLRAGLGTADMEYPLVDVQNALAPATSQLRKNRRQAIHVLSSPVDPNLTLTQTQCPAIVGKRENKNPLRNAGYATPCNPQQPLTAHS